MGKASAFKSKGDWVAFNDVLALIIYGIILFSNIDDFMDITSICIFLLKNPIPTLLVDVYHFIHWINEKNGGWSSVALICYISGSYLTYRANDLLLIIRITSSGLEEPLSGKFHNVPLIGTRGCINYNHEPVMW